MITVLFFAQTRELLGVSQLVLPAEFLTVECVRHTLSQKNEQWDLALTSNALLCAVNQTFVGWDHPVSAGDEVAFFPPVTGG